MRWCVLALAGCAQELPCEPGPVTTWANYGDPFFREWCQGCHASGAPERVGAPRDVTFDDEEQVAAWRTEIAARLEDGTMPPGGGVAAEDVARVVGWLGCLP